MWWFWPTVWWEIWKESFLNAIARGRDVVPPPKPETPVKPTKRGKR